MHHAAPARSGLPAEAARATEAPRATDTRPLLEPRGPVEERRVRRSGGYETTWRVTSTEPKCRVPGPKGRERSDSITRMSVTSRAKVA